MEKKEFQLVIASLFILLVFVMQSISSLYYNHIENLSREKVGDSVFVDGDIIAGYEGEDYIPRSVSINKKRVIDGNEN